MCIYIYIYVFIYIYTYVYIYLSIYVSGFGGFTLHLSFLIIAFDNKSQY